MGASGTGSYAEAPGLGGESAQLRAAFEREGARLAARHPITRAQTTGEAPHRGIDPAALAGVRRGAWLIPKGPFIAAGRLMLALAGIAALVVVGLLAASAVALVQLHLQAR